MLGCKVFPKVDSGNGSTLKSVSCYLYQGVNTPRIYYKHEKISSPSNFKTKFQRGTRAAKGNNKHAGNQTSDLSKTKSQPKEGKIFEEEKKKTNKQIRIKCNKNKVATGRNEKESKEPKRDDHSRLWLKSQESE